MEERSFTLSFMSVKFGSVFLTDPRIRAAYAEGAGIYRIVPAAVAIPQTRADVVALVRRAAETRTALIPRGAGSGMPGGNVGPGVIVDLSAGFSELSVDPQRRSARAGASVTWAPGERSRKALRAAPSTGSIVRTVCTRPAAWSPLTPPGRAGPVRQCAKVGRGARGCRGRWLDDERVRRARNR
mgnify:CR=1 FL=1